MTIQNEEVFIEFFKGFFSMTKLMLDIIHKRKM
jgi:hypothetical protein